MLAEIRLNELGSVVEPFEYPISNAAVRSAVEGITLVYSDGEEPLADVVGRSRVEQFVSVEDVETEVFGNVPTAAIGVPGQSEGDG